MYRLNTAVIVLPLLVQSVTHNSTECTSTCGSPYSTAVHAQSSTESYDIELQTANFSSVNPHLSTSTMATESVTQAYRGALKAEWAVNLVVGILGIVGNVFVIIILVRYVSFKQRLTSKLIINQSAIDAVGAFFLLVVTGVQDADIYVDESKPWSLPFCVMFASQFLIFCFYISSTYNLVFIAIERYISVTNPIGHKKLLTYRNVVLCIVAAWASGFISNVGIISLPNTHIIFTDGTCKSVFAFKNKVHAVSIWLLQFVLVYALPFFIILFCYMRMALKLRKKIVPRGNRDKNQAQLHLSKAILNITKTFAIISGAYILCWSSSMIFFTLFMFRVPGISRDTFFAKFSTFTVSLNCCVNPFIYASKFESFQKGMRSLCRRRRGDKSIKGAVDSSRSTELIGYCSKKALTVQSGPSSESPNITQELTDPSIAANNASDA